MRVKYLAREILQCELKCEISENLRLKMQRFTVYDYCVIFCSDYPFCITCRSPNKLVEKKYVNSKNSFNL